MRAIAHVDMDAFFVSVELLRRPELRGKPVVVGHENSRGVVAAASYEARKHGVHSALPMVTARRRCPEMITVPHDMNLYREASRGVMELMRHYTDTVEVAGLDEAYLDVSASRTPKTRLRHLKAEIKRETGLVCSVGLAPNKLLAKIASDLDKPDGFCVLSRETMLERIGERPASIIPGVGPRSAERLRRIGIRTVADLARASDEKMDGEFGPNHGPAMRDRARGIDDRIVNPVRVRKSESRETTFSHDLTDPELMADTLRRLAASVCAGLSKEGLHGRTITLKLRLAPFRTFTRSKTLGEPTVDPDVVASTAIEMLNRFEIDAPVRLLGVGISSLNDESPDAKPSAGAFEALQLPF